jgi:hypothetical protein
MDDLAIALHVSSVEGHLVFRPATRVLIGAEVDLSAPGNIQWNTAKIVAIPAAEYAEHRSDYDRFLRDGALVRREAPDQEDSHGSR